MEHFDILIIGAGLSGIGAAWRLQNQCPGKRYAILEARSEIGGTWDLFRYPGIRSDSDMFTLGYPFRPWQGPEAIASGEAIAQYIRDTAREGGIEPHIRFNHPVRSANWSSSEACWTVEMADSSTYRCNFLYLCSGYYDYAEGYQPDFPGMADFQGQRVHPQHWPAELDYRNKRIVVIGSGSTAVTLVPALARDAEHVTLLQRSPGYIAALPGRDRLSELLQRCLPATWAGGLARWKNALIGLALYQFCRRLPNLARKVLRLGVSRALPKDYAVDEHFKPHYQPWDQRLCVAPDGDLFKAISAGTASMVTARIARFTASGVELENGQTLPADLSQRLAYKGVMLSDIPNFALCIGYTNASWTLRADLSSQYVCRLLRHMDRHGYRQCVAHCDDPLMAKRPLLNIQAGYILRALDELPKQGLNAPWHVRQNYVLDYVAMRFGRVADGVVRFSGSPQES
jgi:cation diffusion facilitator CzcD-associated flavoprotein CzcO